MVYSTVQLVTRAIFSGRNKSTALNPSHSQLGRKRNKICHRHKLHGVTCNISRMATTTNTCTGSTAMRMLLIATGLSLLQGVSTIRMVDLKVPSHAVRTSPVRLECHYDLEREALYSVKWYKDGKEFFRFLPGEDPPRQVFDQPGVIVDLPNSSDTVVSLQGVDFAGSGLYKCEVSGEAPSFRTVTESKPMLVVELPKEGPHIEGAKSRYSPGEMVGVNCTSARSKPSATLAWFINGEPAEDIYVQPFPGVVDQEGLETTVLGLRFKIRHKHFKDGEDLKLKCLATIPPVYWRSNEQSVQGERPQRAPVLERRGTFNSDYQDISSSSITSGDGRSSSGSSNSSNGISKGAATVNGILMASLVATAGIFLLDLISWSQGATTRSELRMMGTS